MTKRVLGELHQSGASPAHQWKRKCVTQGLGAQHGQERGGSCLTGSQLRVAECDAQGSASIPQQAL